MIWSTFATMPDIPRFVTTPECAHLPWPKRGGRKADVGEKAANRGVPGLSENEAPSQTMPALLRNLTALDLAMLRKLQEFPDAYHAVIEEQRRIERSGGP